MLCRIVLAVAFALPVVVAQPPAQPSSNCLPLCPTQDLTPPDQGVYANTDRSIAGGVVTCYYSNNPTLPDQYYCNYDQTTGDFIPPDGDQDYCPTSAIVVSCTRRKRSALVLRPGHVRNAIHAVTHSMRERLVLKRAKDDEWTKRRE